MVRKTPSPKANQESDSSCDMEVVREKLRKLVRKRLDKQRQEEKAHSAAAWQSRSLPSSPEVITSKLTISLPSSPSHEDIVVVDLGQKEHIDTPIPPSPAKDKDSHTTTARQRTLPLWIRRWLCCLSVPAHPPPPPDEPNRVSV